MPFNTSVNCPSQLKYEVNGTDIFVLDLRRYATPQYIAGKDKRKYCDRTTNEGLCGTHLVPH